MEAPIPMMSTSSPLGTRLMCLGGAILTSALLYLGGIWPSPYTLVAIAALPSPVLFLVAAICPPFIQRHAFLRRYLIGCSTAAVVCLVYDIVWLMHIGAWHL